MKTWILFSRCRTLVANIVAIFALGISSCTALAQVTSENGGLSLRKEQLQDPPYTKFIYQKQPQDPPYEKWFSRERWELALAWTFNPSKFKELWPRYGYNYESFYSSCGSDVLERYDIGSGAIAAPRDNANSNGEYNGYMMNDYMKRKDVESIIAALNGDIGTVDDDPNRGADDVAKDNDNRERDVLRMHEVCEILPANSNSTKDLVIMTQHPLLAPADHRFSIVTTTTGE